MVLRALILSLLSLFHHAPKPSNDVIVFVQSSSDAVRSYADGSVASALERPQIEQIEQNIARLAVHPYDDDAGEALMITITNELEGLHAYDQTLTEREFI